nr:phage portal protein [Polycladospora coralii]
MYNPEQLAELMELNTYHFRAVKTKARDTVGLGWRLEPNQKVSNPNDGQKETAEEFFKRPHVEDTFGEVLERWMIDFESVGNGYLEVIRDPKQKVKNANGVNVNRIKGIETIPAHTMRLHIDDIRFVQMRGNQKRWFIRCGSPYDVDKDTGDLHEYGKLDPDQRGNEIIHIMNYSPRSDYYGIPDVLPALGALLGDKKREEYNIDFFENFAIPAYAVTVEGADLDEEVVKQIKQYFQKDLKENRHSTLVLTAEHRGGDGPPVKFNFEKLAVDMKEASFRLYRLDNRDEVLSAHGVPPYRAGIAQEGSLGGSTATESTEIYKQSIINPRQEIIEARIDRHVLRDSLGITDWEFKFNDIDTRDQERESAINERYFKLGVLTPNDIRESMGKERIDNPIMNQPFIGGTPIHEMGIGGLPQSDELIQSVKSLHSRLLDVVTK